MSGLAREPRMVTVPATAVGDLVMQNEKLAEAAEAMLVAFGDDVWFGEQAEALNLLLDALGAEVVDE